MGFPVAIATVRCSAIYSLLLACGPAQCSLRCGGQHRWQFMLRDVLPRAIFCEAFQGGGPLANGQAAHRDLAQQPCPATSSASPSSEGDPFAWRSGSDAGALSPRRPIHERGAIPPGWCGIASRASLQPCANGALSQSLGLLRGVCAHLRYRCDRDDKPFWGAGAWAAQARNRRLLSTGWVPRTSRRVCAPAGFFSGSEIANNSDRWFPAFLGPPLFPISVNSIFPDH